MKYHSLARSTDGIPDLNYKTWEKRNIVSRLLSVLAGLFSIVCVLPLIAVLAYILIKGISTLSLDLFTQLPPPPGGEGGGAQLVRGVRLLGAAHPRGEG